MPNGERTLQQRPPLTEIPAPWEPDTQADLGQPVIAAQPSRYSIT